MFLYVNRPRLWERSVVKNDHTLYRSLLLSMRNGNVGYKSGKIVFFTGNRLIIQYKDVTTAIIR